MRLAFAIFLALHGLIHLLGFARAYGLAALPQLRTPIGPAVGLLWLVSALLFVAAALAIVLWPRWWWTIGAAAVAASTVAIASAWTDAKAGAAANVIVLGGVAFGVLVDGPWSLRAAYERDVSSALAGPAAGVLVTEADLATLPAPVQQYLRVAGVIGRPRVRTMRARMRGRIRSAPDAPWMPFEAEQHNVFDPPARFFYFTASRLLVPIQGYHRYAGSAAGMRVKAIGLVTVAQADGPAMTRAETVTLLNDMCLLAPAALVDAPIRWEVDSDRAVWATYSNAGQTIRARLAFDGDGKLVDFESDDRGEMAQNGARMTPARWSTPVRAYRDFGPARLMTRGEGRWRDAHGSWSYIELELTDIAYEARVTSCPSYPRTP